MSAAFATQETTARRKLSRADYDRYLPLVRRTAMKLARKLPTTITVADLVSYGWVGLLEAFDRASPDMDEAEFEAYALYRIRGAALDHLRSLDPASRTARGQSRAISRSINSLTKSLGRPPEEEEIAKDMTMSLEQYRTTLDEVGKAGMARLEMLDLDDVQQASSTESPDDAAGKKEMAAAVTTAIEELPIRLQQVLALYYSEGHTLREIGIVLEVTESRACQLHTEAIHRLRAAIGKD
ncbi:MAG: polymerase sigma factor for flagellar operon [Labilithrix sp.]|nr:polymerase sigma factor for flagellar operon [Labilithrix sp.]